MQRSGQDRNKLETHLSSTHLIQREVTLILQSELTCLSLSKIKLLSIVFPLLKTSILVNKRSIYYQAVPLFKTQKRVDSLILFYMKKFQCEMKFLNISAGLKGIFHGSLRFIYDQKVSEGCQIVNNAPMIRNGPMIDQKAGNDSMIRNDLGVNLIPDMSFVTRVEHAYDLVIVIEKETILSKIANKNHLTICGKGFPCKNTIKLLERLEPKVKVICLTDFDPHGLYIYLHYKRSIKEIERRGVTVHDILKHKVRKEECIKMKEREMKMIRKLKEIEEVKEEALFMEGCEFKVELEAIVLQKEFNIEHI